jgi:copper(I)-binding protein
MKYLPLTSVFGPAAPATAAMLATLALCLAGSGLAAHTMPGMRMPKAPAARTVQAVAGPAVKISPAVRALKLMQGWISAAPPGAEELSGYVVLSNPGKIALTLTGVSVPIAGHAMLMTTVRDATGRESMQMASGLKIPAGGTLSVLPGRAHLMLRSLERQPQPGESVPVTLRFSDGSARTLTLPVRKLP